MAFWRYLERAYQLPNAKAILRYLRDVEPDFKRMMLDPANFGMAKSFVMMGKEAGFDMESPEGLQAWVNAYNAIVAPTTAVPSLHPQPSTRKKSRGAPKGTMRAPRRKKKHTTSE